MAPQTAVAISVLTLAVNVAAPGEVTILSQSRSGYAALESTATSPSVVQSSSFAPAGFWENTLRASYCIPSWRGASCETASTTVTQKSSITAGAINYYASIVQNPGSGLYGPSASGQGSALLAARISIDTPTDFHATMIRTGQAFAFPGLAGAITGASPGTPTYPLASLADVSGVLPAGEYNISITSSLGTFAFNTYTVNIAFAEPGQAGACCTGSSCHEAMIAECMGVGMLFGGGGTTCNASGNTTTPCCVADFDHSSLTTVSDVFGFLAAYFAGDSRADVNGGGTSLQDLFDFLQAYLVGGC